MTDKLAEAIALKTVHKVMDETLEAARAYHDLPVVDVETLGRDDDPDTAFNSGYNECLKFLKTTYPQGLKWK